MFLCSSLPINKLSKTKKLSGYILLLQCVFLKNHKLVAYTNQFIYHTEQYKLKSIYLCRIKIQLSTGKLFFKLTGK